jgi:hypothetical protein
MFLKHDASKEGYQRKKYTNFSIYVFRKAFSFFCLFSYYDEKFEFSENDIAEYIKKSFRATSVKQSYENFLNDLIESICVMQRSGMEIEFTHRTFQEYFSAYCLANYIEDQFTEILKILASRPTDGVISMLYEMRRERVEKEFIIPSLRRIIDECDKSGANNSLESHIRYFKYLLYLRPAKDSFRLAMLAETFEKNFVNILQNQIYYEQFEKEILPFSKYEEKDEEVLRSHYLRIGPQGVDSVLISADELLQSSSKLLSLSDLSNSGFADYCRDEMRAMKVILDRVELRNSRASRSLDQILGLKKSR